jgi:hypothetical protein
MKLGFAIPFFGPFDVLTRLGQAILAFNELPELEVSLCEQHERPRHIEDSSGTTKH